MSVVRPRGSPPSVSASRPGTNVGRRSGAFTNPRYTLFLEVREAASRRSPATLVGSSASESPEPSLANFHAGGDSNAGEEEVREEDRPEVAFEERVHVFEAVPDGQGRHEVPARRRCRSEE